MAGSWNHVTTRTGRLRGEDGTFGGMIDNLGDARETIEEMHGMIWQLAARLAAARTAQSSPIILRPTRDQILAIIGQASDEYALGARLSRNAR